MPVCVTFLGKGQYNCASASLTTHSGKIIRFSFVWRISIHLNMKGLSTLHYLGPAIFQNLEIKMALCFLRRIVCPPIIRTVLCRRPCRYQPNRHNNRSWGCKSIQKSATAVCVACSLIVGPRFTASTDKG